MTAFILQRVDEIQTRYSRLVKDFVLLRMTDETLKIVLTLDDNTTLRIVERWQGSELIRYSYYWLDSENRLKVGWDNAPHHRDLAGFPHHKHTEPDYEPVPSTTRTLDDVLYTIERTLRSRHGLANGSRT
jgi:hypothetical protein